jgi:8-oxo-dGTP pyrophosphatase MutT (NUDIX family)
MAPSRESAGGIIINKEGQLLLVHQHSNTWSFPKGGIEPGESHLDAAKREIAEEAGITDLTYVKDLGSYERYSIGKDGVTEQIDWGLRERTLFLFTTNTTDTNGRTDPTGEITETRWVSFDEAKELLSHPKDKEFLESKRRDIEDAISLDRGGEVK